MYEYVYSVAFKKIDLHYNDLCITLLIFVCHCVEAGNTFNRAADLCLQNKSNHEAASHLVEAANCYRKCNSSAALSSLQQAINIYTDMGRFTISAKHHITVSYLWCTLATC